MRRYFSAAEKLKIIELVKNQGVSVSDACRKSRIARKTFYGWLKRYRRERAEGKELTARYVSGGEHWKSLDAKLEGKIVNLAVKDPRNSVHKIARVLPTISNTGVQKVLERNGLSTRGKREIFAQQVRNGAVEYPLPLSTKIHYFLRELPAYPHIFDNQAVRRWGILAFSTVLLTLLGGTFLVGVYGWVKVVLGTPGMSPLGLMFASASLATGSFFFLYSFKYYVSLALVLSFSRRGKKGGAVRERGLGLREKWSEAGERPGVLGQLVRMGNPVLKRVEGVGEGRGLMRWLFAAGEEEEEKSGALINGEIEGIELERKPFVSIHLPMYNEKRVVKRLIESCASMDYLDENGLPNYEILICDDSTDETTKIVEQLAEEINERVIADFSLRQENRGLKSANTNSKSSAGEAPAFIRVLHRPTRKGFKGTALKYALDASHPRTEFIMVFDADFVPFPDTIELFLKHFQFVGKGLSRTKIRKSKVAAVTGYQWHVLNKDENWITRGVRTEYSGSYLIERPARELIGALKIIHGSVYMIRKNALAEVGWGTSITEDFELTLKLYEKGYKVVFTPYVQAPAECVSTLKRLFRQRMRWAEGHSNNVRKMYRRLMFGKWKTENRGQKTEEEDRREKADSRFSIFRRQSSPKGRTWVPSPLSFIEKLEFLYLSPYYLQAALFLVGNISWLIAELVFRVKLPFWTSIWGWSMVLTNMLALPLMNMVGLFVEESEKKDYMGLLSFIALCYLVVPFQAYASVKGFLEKEEGTWFRTPKTGRITFSLARSRFSRLIKIFFPMGSISSPQVGKGLAVKPSFLEPRQSALNWFDDVSHYVGGINRGMKMIGRTVLVFVLLISTLLFNFAPLIEMGVAPVRAGGSVGLKPGEEAGEEKSQALEDSSRPGFGESPAEPDPGVALTDNRVDGEKVSSSKKQVVSEDDQESKLKVEEHNPEKTPEEFYLTVDQIVKARNEGNDLKALREVQLLEGRDSVQMVVGDRQATSLVSDVVKSQIKEIGGEEYLPYYWTKIRMGEEEEAYMIFLRSEAGVQAYVIGTQSMTIALLELEDGAGLSAESAERFEIKALSKPIYQYLTEEVADSPKLSFESPKSLAFSSANWKDYTELLPMEIKAEEKDGVAIFTQEYKLVSSGKTPMVVGETELRVGREGGKQISKLTFRLRDNKNVNRVLWENRVMDGAGCVGDDSADAGPFPGEVDLEPTLLPILVPTPEPVVGVVGAKPTVETLGVTPSNPSLLSVSSILPTVSPMTEVEEITLTGWRAVWQAIAGAARWVYGVVGGAVSRVVSVMVDLFSRVWAWLSVGSGVVYAVGEIGEDKSGESPISSLRCGNVVIDWGDFGETNVVANFSSRSEDRRMNSATTDSSLLTTPIITFYPSGIRGALEVDPTLSTTVASTTVNISVSDEFEIEMDSAKGGVIDSWYDLENDPAKSDQLADATDGLFDFYGDDTLAYAETRYMRGDQQAVNSLTAYDLNTSQSSTGQSSLLSTGTSNGNQNGTVAWGIRVWSRTSGGSESELTSGTPVAQVQRTSAGAGIQSNTWNCPQTSRSTTDSVVVRVYARIADKGVSWTQQAEFTTEQLNASQIESATWTIYYYTEYYTFAGTPSSQRRTDGTFYWGTSTYNSRIANFAWTGAGSERRISDSTSTTQNVIETDGRRAIVEYRGNLGAANFDYVLTYSIYSTGKIYTDFRLTNNTGSSITWRNQRAEITVDSATNHSADGHGVSTDGDSMTPGTNSWIKWVGDGVTKKDAAVLYHYSGFAYNEYFASGTKVALERDATEVQTDGSTTSRFFELQLRPDTDELGTGESGPNGYNNAYHNSDSLKDGLSIGSEWNDSDENTASDNFNEAEGVYVLQANGRSAKFEVDGGTNTRYKPVFKIRKWRKPTEPEAVKLNDSVLTAGADYNVDHKPFSEAWYYDYNSGSGSTYTKLADGGDITDSDEYVGDTGTNYTFSDNFDESGTTGDLFYLGSDDKFSGVNVLMDTLGAFAAGSPSWLTWQYCSANTDTATACDTWSSITDLKSPDSKLVQSLMSNGNFYFDAPSGWVKATANSGRSLYYIRGYNTGAAFTTSPIESKITTDILLFQYLDDISTDDAVFEIDPASHPVLGRHYLDDPYLEGFWAMEEDGSTAEPDLSSNTNNLTVSASDTIPASADEKEGNYSRDFESDEIDTLYIEDGDQTGLDITGNITVMCWYSLEVNNVGSNLISKQTDSDRAYHLWLSDSGDHGYPAFDVSSDGSSYDGFIDGSTLIISGGGWHHFAGVYDGSYLRIYVDGSEDEDAVSYSSGINNSAGDFGIGAGDTYQYPSDGLIDETAVFSRALSATEIAEIYEGGIASHSVEVDNNYKVVLDKDDSDDYLVVYDKAVDNDDPPRVLEFQGPMIEEGTNNEWSLRDDDDRTTNVISSTDTQVKIQVSGKYDDEDADAFLPSESSGADLTAAETYTFDVNGFYVDTDTNFQTNGLDLDNGDVDDGYRWMSVEFEGEASGQTHLESIYYGNGTTEASLAADGAFTNAQTYAVAQGASSYQDAILGIGQTGWLDVQDGDTTNDRSWYYDVDIATNTDRLWTRQQNTQPAGSRNAQWFFQLRPQDELDTEAEREAIINDQRTPDDLADGLTTGSQYKHYLQTKTFQPGASEGIDGLVNSINSDGNYGAFTSIYADSTRRQLLKMDVISSIPSTAACDSAILYGYLSASSGLTAATLQWHEILSANSAWDEGNGGDPASDGSTWDFEDVGASSRWAGDVGGDGGVDAGCSVSGTDYSASTLGSWAIPTSSPVGTEISTSLTASDVEDWFGSTNQNYGMVAGEAVATRELASSDYTVNDTYRPKLSVNYSDTFAPTEGGYGLDAASSTTYDKASMVQFDIDGGTNTRYKPSAKIRKWRSTDLPSAVSLEGETIYEGEQPWTGGKTYNASLKPFSDAYFADELTWTSTLENDASVTNPDIGSAGTLNNAPTYIAGKYGNAMKLNGTTQSADFPVSGNIDLTDASAGVIEFWMQPDWDKSVTTRSYSITGNFNSTDYFVFMFLGADYFSGADLGDLRFEAVNDYARQSAVQIDTLDFSWTVGDWVHVRLEWDDALGSNQLRIYLNGVEPAHTHLSDGGLDVSALSLLSDWYIGDSGTGDFEFDGAIDEFRVYTPKTGAIDDLAQGGNAADSDEYLADITNDYTLDFVADDANNRGEYLFLGSDDKFTGLNYHLGTQGADSSAVFTWQYWNGTAWSSLTVNEEVEGSDNFTTTDGTIYWTQPADWTKYSVNGSVDFYYTRAHLESGSFTTNPIESFIKTDILLFQYLGDISTNDQTFVISSEAIRLSEGSIQIDVPNRYRAIMETGDTQDYILFYDRAQSDSSPNPTHEIAGPHIVEATVRYLLRWDASRTTTILESSSVRVKIRVEGCFDTTAGGACLTDGTDKITVVEDYTFTTEGVFVETATDFQSTGITLDTASGLNGYNWLGVYADVTDAAFDDTATPTILYGDGSTESNTSTDGAVFEDSNKYVVLPGTGSDTYQDAFVGVMRAGWYDDTGGSDTWAWDENNTISGGTTQDLITTREQDHLTIGKHYAKWFFLMLAEDDLDTEAEREGYINDFRNPDILDFTTGSEWQDAGAGRNRSYAASPGLKFDGSGDYVNAGNQSLLNFGDTDDFTIEAWVRRGITSTSLVIASKRNAGSNAGYLLSLGDSASDFEAALTVYDDVDSYLVRSNTNIRPQLASNPRGEWHHIAAVFDQDSAANTTIYVNGVEDKGATSGTIENVGSLSNTYGFAIGIQSPGVGNYYAFDGVIDEVRVWNDVRTAAEIGQNIYKSIDPSSSNLVSYWRLNENTGTTTYDETTNNYDGAITNALWTTGFVADHYNEAEGAYTVEASGSQVELDIDGGSNVSNTLAGAESAGDTSIILTSSDDFPDGGGSTTYYAYINGDKFSFNDNDTATETLSGIPSSGELSIVGHASGLVVAMSNRHKPMFKIRGYQLNDKPSLVTMEGSSLTEGIDYNVDYVPISDAYFADELTWYSTLESETAAESPDIGTGDAAGSLVVYAAGKYGDGAEFDGSGDRIYFPVADNIDLSGDSAGVIEFWMQPDWDSTTTTTTYVMTGNYNGTDGFSFVFAGSDLGSSGELYFVAFDSYPTIQSALVVANGNFLWKANDWVHITLMWDDTLATGDLSILINGAEPTHSHTNEGSLDISALTLLTAWIIGDQEASSALSFDGVIDEFRVYTPLTEWIDDLAQGGNTADSSEYLFSEAQDYTLDFEPVDASNRGEYAFFGADSMFSGINVDLETVGATGGTLNLDWEYWNGSAWASLESISGFTDGTSNLTQDGAVYWSANPTNWRKYSVNGSTDLYYIRASLNSTSGTYTTSPVENFIKTDMLVLQYLGSISSADQTLVVIPERLWLLLSVIPFVPGLLRRRKEKSIR